MLSYRHSFHAGNHADVIKHITLIAVIEKLKKKNKPFVYIDTHSGRGLYDLSSDESRKTAEFEQGIGRLLDNSTGCDQIVIDYIDYVSQYMQSTPPMYPGSPSIACDLLREQDKCIFMELHSDEIAKLKRNFNKDSRIAIHHRDGFEGLNACMPPEPARGLVLIDPAYEVKQDYADAIKALKQSIKKWSHGIFLLWYPKLARQRDRSEQLKNELAALPIDNLLAVELDVEAQQAEFGMYGSGMLIVNAPYQLDTLLEPITQQLASKLAQDANAKAHIEWLIEPK
ncbi:protein involved in catabolism of external DNA [Catenovulum agarivorans DS-2]|uniref:Ribosomal RNA large subunit methyltransferase J n=1 Tax=Catenovulum agarivorans DS-2 TaxID=1328313 RepID=W7QLX9_9ALTE|nr:23S rRNA (adenine(2030)-N(6))-methyltransferase RlmJ [Catenovulum agarivorans]EWH09962.1 protein involved in catabolism of external DNA [Catenovulum agarivorans DS-2]